MMRVLFSLGVSLALALTSFGAETETVLLSGSGPDDAVEWDFFCTGGRNSRVWSKIRVPSCWEQQGYGSYNYGGSMQHDTGDIVGNEQGLYRRTFTVPAAWQGRVVRLVFDGSMTDTSVWINGQSAGPTHRGAFYRFHYDITALVHWGAENLIEVTVAKNSSNRSINDAERAADYWVFGGIFRPVWLEALPARFIDWTAIDARADGSFMARVHLGAPVGEGGGEVRAEIVDADGRAVGAGLTAPVEPGEAVAVVQGRFGGIKRWSAETPHLYRVKFTASVGGCVHTVTERFGFRTIEVRENDGVYLNGTKIVLKGVNRHCFWPETGRTVSREQSYSDARLIKAANMNAVRMAHYPPDKHFLEACDELGLYVLNELGGWQKPYDIQTGARLIGQLVRRDVNHPCILFWDNGNEGGWKQENDAEFARWDPQNRAVLHPWAINSGINTDHYEPYESTVTLSAGPQIFMPTEFLHGLWDGGIGAGLRDYWDVMGRSPTVAGGFFWVWSDEGVVRTDQNGRIDNAGNQAPDGMVGPHRELEGSYFTVKEIWSPVQVTTRITARGEIGRDWDGLFRVDNLYAFTDLAGDTIDWEFLGGDRPCDRLAWGTLPAPAVAPGSHGTFQLPKGVWANDAPVFRLRWRDATGSELWTWSWFREPGSEATAGTAQKVETSSARPDPKLSPRPLGQFTGAQGAPAPPPGPRLVAYRHVNKAFEPVSQGVELGPVRWTDLPDGARRCDFTYTVDAEVDILGVAFDLAQTEVKSKRWLGRGPYRVYRNRMEGVVIDLHEVAWNDPIPGESFTYPEFKGYFRDWRWLELDTGDGRLRVENLSAIPYFGLYAPRDGTPSMQEFPDTGLAFLEVIPAMGSKFAGPETTGPRGVTPHARGVYSGSILFRLAR